MENNTKSPEYIEFLRTRISPNVKPEIAELMLYYALNEDVHSDRYQGKVREICFKDKMPVDRATQRPKIYLIIAQTGAGKSNLTMSVHRKDNNIVIIDSDQFKSINPYAEEIKQKYPQYYGYLTGLDAYLFRDEAYSEALQYGYNILIEIAPSSKELLFNIDFEELEHYGYDIEAYVLAVSEENSLLSIHERYEGQIEGKMESPKLTDLSRARDSASAVPIVVKQLLEEHPDVKMRLLKRAVIGDSESQTAEPIFVTDDSNIFLDKYREIIDEDRKLTLQEADERIERVRKQMSKRNALETQVNQFDKVCGIIHKTTSVWNK